MNRPTIEPTALSAILEQYPDLGDLLRIRRNGLSVNTATCLFETSRGAYFAKAYDPLQRDPVSILAEHSLVWKLLEGGYPTPRLLVNRAETTVTWHGGQAFVLTTVAQGEDRYGSVGVFEAFQTHSEARAAGAAQARFHLLLADGPALSPKPFRGLTARYELLMAPSVEEGFEALLQQAPSLRSFLAGRPDWPSVRTFAAVRQEPVAAHAPALPQGLIHGDFIKRNLFWQGHEVSDVIDFDLWNVGYWVYDLALALLPCGFDWPALLKGEGTPRIADMQSYLEGYQSVRRLTSAESAVLPTVLETARVEFYLGAIATMIDRGDAVQAERFYDLLLGTTRWFHEHPEWASGLMST
ncbi:MAG TPA: phosphotransferase [Stenomitos sp.]